MAQDNKIYVTGHLNPHADSITAAIGYASYLRAQGKDAVPCRLGQLNDESRYLLERFGFEAPQLLETAKVRMDEIDLEEPISIRPDTTIWEAVQLMREKKRESFCVTDDDGKIVGWVSQTDLAKIALSDTIDSMHMIKDTSTEFFCKTINGQLIYDDPERKLNGKVSIVTVTDKENLENYDVKERIVITGGKKKALETLLEKGAGMLIVIWAKQIDQKILDLAKERHCPIIISGYGAMNTSRYLYFAPPVHMMMSTKIIRFYSNELAEEVEKKMGRTRFRSYPVVDDKDRFIGYVSRMQIMNYKNKKLILVDHNEFSRSVNGIEKAEVLEVIDHHRVTDFSTPRPVSFRNEIVGSTSTIIATIFRENQVSIDENLAGLLLGGLLSDTMDLRTPTTTDKDRQTANILAALANVDREELADALFSLSEAESKSIADMIGRDCMFKDKQGYRMLIAKMNVRSVEQYVERADEVQQSLDRLTRTKEVDLGVLAITSAVENGSILFSSGDRAEWVQEAFPNKADETHSFQKGIVSRKAQIVPKVSEVIDKYA